MNCIDCDGRLKVKDSKQKAEGKSLYIIRCRICLRCGKIIYSTEKVEGAKISEGYKHN